MEGLFQDGNNVLFAGIAWVEYGADFLERIQRDLFEIVAGCSEFFQRGDADRARQIQYCADRNR